MAVGTTSSLGCWGSPVSSRLRSRRSTTPAAMRERTWKRPEKSQKARVDRSRLLSSHRRVSSMALCAGYTPVNSKNPACSPGHARNETIQSIVSGTRE